MCIEFFLVAYNHLVTMAMCVYLSSGSAPCLMLVCIDHSNLPLLAKGDFHCCLLTGTIDQYRCKFLFTIVATLPQLLTCQLMSVCWEHITVTTMLSVLMNLMASLVSVVWDTMEMV